MLSEINSVMNQDNYLVISNAMELCEQFCEAIHFVQLCQETVDLLNLFKATNPSKIPAVMRTVVWRFD